MTNQQATDKFYEMAVQEEWTFQNRPSKTSIAQRVWNEVHPTASHQSLVNKLLRELDKKQRNPMFPMGGSEWRVFRSSTLSGIKLARSTGGRAVISRGGRALFTMDNNDVRDLIDTLQKYLAVTE